jgi:hypothetical protein
LKVAALLEKLRAGYPVGGGFNEKLLRLFWFEARPKSNADIHKSNRGFSLAFPHPAPPLAFSGKGSKLTSKHIFDPKVLTRLEVGGAATLRSSMIPTGGFPLQRRTAAN